MTTIRDEILELISGISRSPDVVIDDFDRNLEELGMDSLDTMTLLMDAEEKYSIKFTADEANELSTVNQFVGAIESKKSN